MRTTSGRALVKVIGVTVALASAALAAPRLIRRRAAPPDPVHTADEHLTEAVEAKAGPRKLGREWP